MYILYFVFSLANPYMFLVNREMRNNFKSLDVEFESKSLLDVLGILNPICHGLLAHDSGMEGPLDPQAVDRRRHV